MSIDFGYRIAPIRTRLTSSRIPVRAAAVTAILTAVAIALAVIALAFGDFPLTLAQVWAVVTGGGDPFHRMIVLEWRMPVAVAAIGFGALLAIGGAVFQTLTRNPLGSPDVIGFDAGSYTAVVITIILLGTRNQWSITAAALIGGLATALVVYVLAYRRGIQGFRLIIVGIAVAAALGSANAFLMSRADITDAITVGFWGAGSISRVSWGSLLPALAVGAVVVILVGGLSPSLRRLELGDDAATTLGDRPTRVRVVFLVLGVVTVALVTAAAGPISFIALAAPQLARRLTGTPGVGLFASAAMGALLLSSSYLLSLVVAVYYRPIPVGLITVCIGGLYLIWLLIRETRVQYGAPR